MCVGRVVVLHSPGSWSIQYALASPVSELPLLPGSSIFFCCSLAYSCASSFVCWLLKHFLFLCGGFLEFPSDMLTAQALPLPACQLPQILPLLPGCLARTFLLSACWLPQIFPLLTCWLLKNFLFLHAGFLEFVSF